MASSTCVFEFKYLADTFHVFWQSYRNFNLATGNRSQWVASRMASFPAAAFRVSCASPPLCVPLEIFVYFLAAASFCRLAASLMFAICFCSSRFFFFEVSLFLGRVLQFWSFVKFQGSFEEILQLFRSRGSCAIDSCMCQRVRTACFLGIVNEHSCDAIDIFFGGWVDWQLWMQVALIGSCNWSKTLIISDQNSIL